MHGFIERSWGLALILIPFFYTDLVPRVWSEWARVFHLKTVGYVFVALVLGKIFHRYRMRVLPKPAELPVAEIQSRYV